MRQAKRRRVDRSSSSSSSSATWRRPPNASARPGPSADNNSFCVSGFKNEHKNQERFPTFPKPQEIGCMSRHYDLRWSMNDNSELRQYRTAAAAAATTATTSACDRYDLKKGFNSFEKHNGGREYLHPLLVWLKSMQHRNRGQKKRDDGHQRKEKETEKKDRGLASSEYTLANKEIQR
jgi:hypothetical protein